MRTITSTFLAAALALSAAAGAAQAQQFPQEALPSRAPAATDHAPGTGYGASSILGYALPTVAPSASDRAPLSGYDAYAQFPHSAAPSVTTQPSLVLTTRVAPNR